MVIYRDNTDELQQILSKGINANAPLVSIMCACMHVYRMYVCVIITTYVIV